MLYIHIPSPTTVGMFVFLALQPIVVVFSQPGSGFGKELGKELYMFRTDLPSVISSL